MAHRPISGWWAMPRRPARAVDVVHWKGFVMLYAEAGSAGEGCAGRTDDEPRAVCPDGLRVLHVTDSYLPRIGGIELHIADLVAALGRRGHQAHVLTRHGFLPSIKPLTRQLSMVPPYDVVHVHASVYSPLAWRTTLLCARRHLPVVYTARSLLTGVNRLYRIAARVLGLARLPVVWSAVSHIAARSLATAMNLRPNDARVLPNAVDPSAWRPVGPPHESDVVTFVAVMRLAARKRPLALLRAFRAAGTSGRARLVVVGDGPLANACHRWCCRHPDVDVRLVGARSREQIRKHLADADAFLAPSRRESFGIATLEARESGLPVIAYRGTGVVDFIEHGRQGLLVGNDAEMTTAVRDLVADRPLLRRLTADARASSSGFDWANAVPRAEDAYHAAIRLQAGTESRDTPMDRTRMVPSVLSGGRCAAIVKPVAFLNAAGAAKLPRAVGETRRRRRQVV